MLMISFVCYAAVALLEVSIIRGIGIDLAGKS